VHSLGSKSNIVSVAIKIYPSSYDISSFKSSQTVMVDSGDNSYFNLQSLSVVTKSHDMTDPSSMY